jgi:YHS domain-containing protein
MWARREPPMVDPICGMQIEATTAVAACVFIGQTYGFCSEECYALFLRAPERCVAYLAHSPEGHYGHLCPCQRRAEHPP